MNKAPSKLLAGAEACLAMLAAIENLKPVPDEDGGGTRRDYESCARILNQAMDRHGGDAGFRHALSVYLQSVADGDTPTASRETGESLLTDGGCRAMPQEPAEVAVDGGAQAKYGRILRREQLLARLPVLLDGLIEALGEFSGDSQASYVFASVAREAACELEELGATDA